MTTARAPRTPRTPARGKPVTAPRRRRATVQVPHLSVSERVARGKAARAEVPRWSHAAFEPVPHRVDPVELLEQESASRVPELVPIRYGRMLVSPFTFYRGAAAIMAADLAATPRSGLIVQCCGDAHLSNFGAFASPERRLVFDLNDFDETLPGPWEWDIKRLAVSMLIGARDNRFTVKDQDEIVLATVEEYRNAMATFAGMTNLEVWYAHLDIDKTLAELGSQLTPKIVKQTEKTLAKARTRDSMSAFDKLTQVVDGEPRIVADPPLIVPYVDLAEGEAASADLRRDAPAAAHLSADAGVQPARPRRAVPPRRRRAQGRRRRQRRHARLDRADARP